MGLLIIVSCLPSIVTLTVTVKGEPAVTVEGAVKLRIACGVAQPKVIDTATIAVNAQSRRAHRASRPSDPLLGTQRRFAVPTVLLRSMQARPAQCHIDSKHGAVDINAVIRKLGF